MSMLYPIIGQSIHFCLKLTSNRSLNERVVGVFCNYVLQNKNKSEIYYDKVSYLGDKCCLLMSSLD